MLISIDPGSGGGLAWIFKDKIYAATMPQTPKDIYIKLKSLVIMADGYESVTAYIEKVGTYMPGNAATAAVAFARHCGHLDMALLALNIPYHEITAKKWQQAFVGRVQYPKSMTSSQKKAKRKNLIKTKAQQLYPHLKITLKTADALGILTYALKVT